MSSIYEMNMAAISKRYTVLADKLKHLPDDYNYKVVPTAIPNRKTLSIKKDEQEWILHSKEDPVAEANAYANHILPLFFDRANVLIFLGIGMGYYLDAVFARYAGNMPCVILVEPDLHIFKSFISTQMPMATMPEGPVSLFSIPGCALVVGVPIDQVYASIYEPLNNMSKQSFTTMQFIEHPIEIRSSKQYFKPFCKEVSRVAYDIKSSYGNDPEDSWFGIDHMLQNLDLIAANPGVSSIKDKFIGKPAVIVATGPSLDKNIDLLPEIKGKCVFFAADASLNTFSKRDPKIVPDIVCSLERNLSTCNHFKQIEDKSIMHDIYLGACPVVKPQVYEAWHGKHIVVFRDFAHFRWLMVDKGILNTGKSVTNMAYKIAEYMGCDPIILVGQDLAYAPDGTSHVQGADHARDGLKASQLTVQKTKVLGNNGEMLDSLETWVGMLKRFEFDIAMKPRPYTVINATEGGARINGTQVMTLREAIDKYIQEDIDVSSKLSEFLSVPSAEKKDIDLKSMNAEIDRGVAYIDYSIKELQDALHAMEEGCSLFKDNKINDKVHELMQYCEKVKDDVLRHDMCYFTIMHVIQSWCMGRENILKSLNETYKGDELIVAKFLRIFEFFFGLLTLYRHVQTGIARARRGKEQAST